MVQFLFEVLRHHLPDEIIQLIIFKYRCVKHPIVNLLLNYTKNLYFENNQKAYLGLEINSAYNNLKSKDGDINQLLKEYFNNNMVRGPHKYWKDTCNWHLRNCQDFGYYLKRPWGRLYYYRKYDHNKVQEGMILGNWNLSRSKKMIDKIACNCEYLLKYYYNVNEEEVKRNSCIGSHINYDSITKDLMFLENKLIKKGEYICSYCKMDKERYKTYHENQNLIHQVYN